MPQREQAGVRIAVASNADEAEFLRGALTFAGVPCVLDSVEIEDDPSEWVKQAHASTRSTKAQSNRADLIGCGPQRSLSSCHRQRTRKPAIETNL